VTSESKALLASDRLGSIASRENTLHQEAQRTSDALAWLDRRLEADIRASRKALGDADELPAVVYGVDARGEEQREAEADVHAAVLQLKHGQQPPGRTSRIEQVKERVARSHGSTPRSVIDEPLPVPPPGAVGGSVLSARAREQLARIASAHRSSDAGSDAGGDAGAARSPRRGPGLWAARPREEERGAVRVLPNADVWSMSDDGRRSAAPHVADLYRQIFIADARDLPPADAAAAARLERGPAAAEGPAVGAAHGDDRALRIELVLAEGGAEVAGWKGSWGSVPDARSARRSAWERALLADVAAGVGAAPHRLCILGVARGARGTWATLGGGEVRVALRVVPDADPAAPPCRELARRLAAAAADSSSALRARGATRHARGARVEAEEEAAAAPAAAPAAAAGGGGAAGRRGGGRARGALPVAVRDADGFWLSAAEPVPVDAPALGHYGACAPAGSCGRRGGRVVNGKVLRVYLLGAAAFALLFAWVALRHAGIVPW
jgi:hypothetical protein